MDASNWINVSVLAVTALMAFLAWQQTRLARMAQREARVASEAAAHHEMGANAARHDAAIALSRMAEEIAAQGETDALWVASPESENASEWRVTNWTGKRVIAHLRFSDSSSAPRLSHPDLYGELFETWLNPGDSLPFFWVQNLDDPRPTERVDVIWGLREGEARITRLRVKWLDV